MKISKTWLVIIIIIIIIAGYYFGKGFFKSPTEGFVTESVRKGEVLAQLDASQVSAQLQSAKSELDYTINQYNSGLASAKDNLQSAYKESLNVLNDSYTKIYNAYKVVTDL